MASRTVGLPFGPDLHNAEAVGALDVMSCVLEAGLIAGCAALLWRPSLADRPAPRRGALASTAALAAVPVAVIAATTAVMTPGWAGPEGPAGMAASMVVERVIWHVVVVRADPAGMGDMGSTDGLPDMQMYGSTAAPTAAQVVAAAQLIQQTDTSLKRYANVQAAFAAGYTYVLKTNGEEHLLYDGPNPAYQGLNPQDPSSLVYAINVPHHAPILLGAMYIMGDQQNGPQVGGGLTRWHSHLVTCVGGQQTIAGFGVQLRGGCNPATWQDRTPRRCCTSGSSPTRAASSPTTSARRRPAPRSRRCWRSTAPRDVRPALGSFALGRTAGLAGQLPPHDPVRSADGNRSAEHVAVDDDHRSSGLRLAAQLRGLGAEHRAAVHPHVDPVGHEDGYRPEPDGGVDGGDMLADDTPAAFPGGSHPARSGPSCAREPPRGPCATRCQAPR